MKTQPTVLKASSKRGKAMKQAMKTRGIVIPDIERYLMTLVDNDRSTTVLHPSEITKTGWCPRQSNYQILGTPMEVVKDDVSPHLRRIFEEGDAIHTKYQKWMWRTGNLMGVFYCLRCTSEFWARSPTKCWVCKAPHWAMEYHEVPVISAQYGIAGKSDGLYINEDEETGLYEEVLVEIKSVGEGTVRVLAPELYERVESGEWTLTNLWSEIKQPFTAHTRQAVLYALVLGLSKVSVIYECKWNQSWREFIVTAEPWMVQSTLNNCEAIVAARARGTVVERPTWAEPAHKTCKSCPYQKVCWDDGGEA